MFTSLQRLKAMLDLSEAFHTSVLVLLITSTMPMEVGMVVDGSEVWKTKGEWMVLRLSAEVQESESLASY